MRNPDFFYKKTAEEMGLDYKIVEKVNKFYWRKGVRESLVSCEHPSIFVKGIGTFYPALKAVNKKILRLIRIIRKLRVAEYKRPSVKEKKLESCFKSLRELLKLRNVIITERKERKEKYYSNNGKIVGISEDGGVRDGESGEGS